MEQSEVTSKSLGLRVSKVMFIGLKALVPVMGTIWILYIVYRSLLGVGDMITDAVIKLWNPSTEPEQLLERVPALGLVHFLLPLCILLVLGLIVRNRVGSAILKGIENVATRLPLAGFVYKSLVQFVAAIDELGKDRQFKSVVYVEYPSPGCRLIGFVTSESTLVEDGNEVTSVFIPTSPNPLTGFLLLIDNDKVQPSSMTVEQASKMVLSAGLVAPV
ncbi:DUF502 domain-containing protein [Rubritalea marina]|uniref:DUF502 domain-containing protein n=1 Tax=Rubritalea marina TaxID=361055 RepID=UPI000A01800F|nr:DUF502 domain-containing protein [Rubritalea marina]